jgi:hypothetical protein
MAKKQTNGVDGEETVAEKTDYEAMIHEKVAAGLSLAEAQEVTARQQREDEA